MKRASRLSQERYTAVSAANEATQKLRTTAKMQLQGILQATPEFEGRMDTLQGVVDLQRLIRACAEMEQVGGADPAELASMLAQKFRGIAEAWWRSVRNEQLQAGKLAEMTPSFLARCVQGRFMPPDVKHLVLDKILHMDQRTAPLGTFLEEFRHVTTLAELEDYVLTYGFLRALRPEVAAKVRNLARDTTNWCVVQEAVLQVARTERMTAESSFGSAKTLAISAHAAHAQQHLPGIRQAETRKPGKAPGTCFGCGQEGHYLVVCPHRRRRHKTKEATSASKAPLNKRASKPPTAANTAKVEVVRAAKAAVPDERGHGADLTFMLDSGAERHLIDERSSSLLGTRPTGQRYKVRVANGQLCEGCEQHDVAAHIGLVNFVLRKPIVLSSLSENLLSTDALNDEGIEACFLADRSITLASSEWEVCVVMGNSVLRRLAAKVVASELHIEGKILRNVATAASFSFPKMGQQNECFAALAFPEEADLSSNDEEIEAEMKSQPVVHDVALVNNEKLASVHKKKIHGRTIMEWHETFGHASIKKLRLILKQMEPNAKILESDLGCDACRHAKQTLERVTRKPIPVAHRHGFMAVVHADLVGPLRPETLGKKKWMLNLVEDHTRFARTFLLPSKEAHEVAHAMSTYLSWTQTVTGKCMKILRSDQGKEFDNENLRELLRRNGAELQMTTGYTPHQNGTVERFNRTIIEKIRASLVASKLPLWLWGEVAIHLVYVYNHSPHRALEEKTPAALFFPAGDPRREVKKTRIFPLGCRIFATIPKERRESKFEKVADAGWYVGIAMNEPGVRFWLEGGTKIYSSSHVTCDVQTRFKPRNGAETEELELGEAETSKDEFNIEQIIDQKVDEHGVTRYRVRWTGYSPEDDTWERRQTLKDTEALLLWENPSAKTASAYAIALEEEEVSGAIPYHIAIASADRDEWKEAMEAELASIEEREVWDVVPRPQKKNVISTKWVLVNKRLPPTMMMIKKARLVARGFSQIPEIDFGDTYSPTVSKTGLRLVLAIGVHLGMRIHAIDCKTAFLNGTIDRELYVEQPPGFPCKGTAHATHVCMLKKSLYGLKQSPLIWYLALRESLEEAGFVCMSHEPCIFVHVTAWSERKRAAKARGEHYAPRLLAKCIAELKKDAYYCILAVYVDDITIAAMSDDGMRWAKQCIAQQFRLRDDGEVKRVVGIDLERSPIDGALFVHQKIYIDDVLSNNGLSQLNAVRVPMQVGSNLAVASRMKEADGRVTDTEAYLKNVGELMFCATSTRLDLSLSVGICSRYNSAPLVIHSGAVKSIFRYLKGSADMGLVYAQAPPSIDDDKRFRVVCCSDSDHAGDHSDSKSTSGFVVFVGGSPVAWRSQKQKSVATSTVEAEYMAASAATKEILWVARLTAEMVPLERHRRPLLRMDSEGARRLAMTECIGEKSKHIRYTYHFIRECVQKELIELEHVPGDENVADMLTKPLAWPRFERLRSLVGMMRLSDFRARKL